MQLEALLTSFSRTCEEADQVAFEVLYAATSTKMEAQYQLLDRTWRGRMPLTLHRERAFRADLLAILPAPDRRPRGRRGRPPRRLPGAVAQRARDWLAWRSDGAPYLLILADDTVFCRPFSMATVVHALEARPRAFGFSLRLGRNTTYCHMHAVSQRVPRLALTGGGVVGFDWTEAEGDFGYPMEVSSSVYSAARIARRVSWLGFSNPNTLEPALAWTTMRRRWSPRSPELLCFEHSVAFSNDVNMVQTEWPDRFADRTELCSEELARRFDDGQRIDTDAFSRFTPDSCHCQVPYSFVSAALVAAGDSPEPRQGAPRARDGLTAAAGPQDHLLVPGQRGPHTY
jgi:hypothetical protein